MKLLHRHTTTDGAPEAQLDGCTDCASSLLHCHHVLVLHLDGTAECEGHPRCLLDAGCHDHWLSCSELQGCGCTGDDHDLDEDLPLAA